MKGHRARAGGGRSPGRDPRLDSRLCALSWPNEDSKNGGGRQAMRRIPNPEDVGALPTRRARSILDHRASCSVRSHKGRESQCSDRSHKPVMVGATPTPASIFQVR